MKPFEFYNTIKIAKDKEKLSKTFSKLNNLYHKIPKTKGCMENIEKEDGCNAWCCVLQSPQMLYSEFLMAWDYISKNWTDEEICDLFERCMLNAVNPLPSKGCVFFDGENNLCKIHKRRPLNCRIYGITPKEEFEPRYLRLEEEYKSILGAVCKPQCGLVSTVDGEEVTKDDTDSWWEGLVDIEEDMGVPKKLANDGNGGSYRSPHDHVLVYNMPDNVLNAVAGIKKYKTLADKKEAIGNLVKVLKGVFTNKS